MVETIKNVVQLSEAVTHPDGYNVVDVEGRGDERRVEVFPWVTISSNQSSVSSDGQTPISFEININDPNSLNPFQRSYEQWEKASVDGENRFEFQPSLYLHNLIAVYEYVSGDSKDNYDLTYQIPNEYLSWDGRNVYISPSYKSPLHPEAPDWSGPGVAELIVVYDGGPYVSLRQGAQTDPFWWEEEPDDDLADDEVAGVFFDSAKNDITDLGDVLPIPEVTGQEATLYGRFLPETGEYGQSTLNVNYEQVADDVTIAVTMGDLVNVDIDFTAEPSTIAPEGTSVLSVYLTDYKGNPLNDVDITIYLYNPTDFGKIVGGSGQSKTLTQEDYEETESDGDNLGQLDVSYPIDTLKDIRVQDGDPTNWTWNGNAEIRGTTIVLDEENYLPDGGVALEILYDHGGYFTCTYQADEMEPTDDAKTIKIKAEISGHSAMVNVTVDPSQVSTASLSVGVDPSSIELNEEATVTVTLADADGEPLDGKSVKLSLTSVDGSGSNGSIVGSVSPKLGDEETVEASISDRYTVSAPQQIGDVIKVEYGGTEYDVASWSGSSITLAKALPVATGQADLTYKTGGIATATYTGPNEDRNITINAYYAEDDLLASTEITVGDPGVEPEVTVIVSSDKITAPEKARISVLVEKSGTPVVGAKATITKKSGPGLTPEILIGPDTGEDGLVEWCYETVRNGGIAIFEVEVSSIPGYTGKIQETTKITVGAYPNISSSEQLVDVLLGEVSGWMDPISGQFEITDGSTIDSWGSGEDCDEYGGVAKHPTVDGDPIEIGWSPSAFISSGDLRSVSVSGMTWVPDQFESGDDPAFWILEGLVLTTEWEWEYNRRQTTVQIVLRHAPENPIAGVQVKVQGQTAVTDESGNAQFLNLDAGKSDIEIYSPNHKLNRSDISIQTDHDQADDNDYNKTITIPTASTKPYLLKLTEFSGKVTASVVYSTLYDDYLVSGGHFEIPEDDDDDDPTVSATATADPCSMEEEEPA